MAIGPGAMASNMKSAHEWPKFPPLMSQIIGIIGVGSVISGLLLANDMHMRAAIAGCAGSGNNLGVLDYNIYMYAPLTAESGAVVMMTHPIAFAVASKKCRIRLFRLKLAIVLPCI